MKKNLRNILVLSLGLITTIATAQISASNSTWIDNTDSDARTGYSLTTVAADWGGIHLSTDYLYSSDGSVAATHGIYEAYASTDLMGFATLTMGQQDLSYGSGALMSSNNGITYHRFTTQGVNFATSLAGLDVTVGMFDLDNESSYINASGSFAGANVNILMMNAADGSKAHGYDLSYGMGDFSLSASMNSDFDGDEMTSYSVSWDGFDNLTVHAGITEYEGNFGMATSANNLGVGYGNLGGPGGLVAGDKNTSMGVAYDLGDISFGYTRHSVENETNGDFDANTMSIGYTLNDNCTLGVMRNDYNGTEHTLINVKITM